MYVYNLQVNTVVIHSLHLYQLSSLFTSSVIDLLDHVLIVNCGNFNHILLQYPFSTI